MQWDEYTARKVFRKNASARIYVQILLKLEAVSPSETRSDTGGAGDQLRRGGAVGVGILDHDRIPDLQIGIHDRAQTAGADIAGDAPPDRTGSGADLDGSFEWKAGRLPPIGERLYHDIAQPRSERIHGRSPLAVGLRSSTAEGIGGRVAREPVVDLSRCCRAPHPQSILHQVESERNITLVSGIVQFCP